MKETSINLPSKMVLKIQSAPFEEAHKLYKAVMGVVSTTSFASGEIINLLAKITISPEVEAALWPCMGRATWNGQRITQDLFEQDAARGDYLLIVKEVLTFNLAPFLQSLGSVLSQLSSLSNTVSQKSK